MKNKTIKTFLSHQKAQMASLCSIFDVAAVTTVVCVAVVTSRKICKYRMHGIHPHECLIEIVGDVHGVVSNLTGD